MKTVSFLKGTQAVPSQLAVVVKNTSGTDLSKGDWVCLDASNTDEDTLAATTPATGNLTHVIGACLEDIPDEATGLVQWSGFIKEALVLGHASLTRGSPLALTDGQVYAVYSAGADDTITAMETYTTTSAALKKVFLRNRIF